MASEIGEAYVRVRPNMTGFKSGVESGVRSGFSNLAKIAGVAFAGAEAFRFGKDLITHAADLQKQVEVVKAEFGGASQAVLDFNEKAATGLGISAHAADTTAARMGILFKNLGVGQQTAATATTDLIKLAGSLSAIRGIDPAVALKNLPLAIAGNLRSLKQLGISTDQNQIKAAAMQLGYLKLGGTLTPAARALAITAIATKNLSDFQAQAAAHSGDLVNVQYRLKAAWDNAKDSLGKGLLPAVTAVVRVLAVAMPPAVNAVHSAFSALSSEVRQFAKFVGPILHPVLSLFGTISKAFGGGSAKDQLAGIRREVDALAKTGTNKTLVSTINEELKHVARGGGAAQVAKIQEQLSSVGAGQNTDAVQKIRDQLAKFAAGTGGAIGAIGRLKKLFEGLSPAGKGAVVAIGAVLGVLATFTVGLLSPWIAIPLAIGAAAVAFRVAYTHSARFRDIVGQVGDFIKGKMIPAVEEIAHKAAPAFAALWQTVKVAFDDIKQIIETWVGIAKAIWSRFGDTFKTIAKNYLGFVVRDVRDVMGVIRGIIDFVTGLITGDWSKAWKGLKSIFSHALDDVLNVVELWGKNIAAIFQGVWQNIERISLVGVKKVLDVIGKIPTSFSIFGKRIGFENPAEKAAKSLGGIIDSIDAAKAAKDAADQIAKTTQDAVASRTSGRGGDIVVTESTKLGKKIGDTVKKGVHDGVATGVNDGITTGANAGADSAVTTAKASIANLSAAIAQALVKEKTDVAAAVVTAKQNLQSIMATVSGDIGQIIDEPLNALSNRLALQQNKLTLENLRRSVLLPGGKTLSKDPVKALAELNHLLHSAGTTSKGAVQSLILEYQQALLGVQQSQATITKDRVSRSFLDLADAAAKGKITPKQFHARFLAELKKDNISFARAGATGGQAFADGFRGNVKGLFAQLAALKGFTGGKSGAGDVPTVTKPLDVLHKDQQGIAKQQRELAAKQHALAEKQLKAAQKASATLTKIHSTQLGPTAKALSNNPGHQSKTAKTLTGTK